MEYAEKGDLEQFLKGRKSKGLLSEKKVWEIFFQVVAGLHELHSKNILHRDLKSANIFLSKKHVKIGDLNVAKESVNGLLYTQTGTPFFASPEVWRDEPYDFKSDIWSLGVILYNLLTLKLPFRSKNMQTLSQQVLKGEIPEIPECFSSSAKRMINVLLTKDPSKRPNTGQLMKILTNSKVEQKLKHSHSRPKL